MEKTRIYVVRGTEAEEPLVNTGYICSFKDLTIRTVLLDDIMRNPEKPDKSMVVDVEIKSLRDAKNLLEKMDIQEAAKFIEKNNHPKLWSLLAESALNRLDTATAEHAYVMLKDYGGIQLVKRLKTIQLDSMKRAEVATFFGRLDEAEKIYMDNDRRDLAISMRKKMNDWFRIVEILQKSTGPGDDQLLKEAWDHVGDYYADRQNWTRAASYYEQSENYEQLIRCCLMTDDYDKLEVISKKLPERHPLLERIGEIFGGAGLCEQALDSYLRSEMLDEALDICIQLNQWDKAVKLSKTHNLRDVSGLLGKYAEQLSGSNERSLAAIQLYRRAGKYLEAAKIVFEIANEERAKRALPLRLKKIYVLGALLIEQYRSTTKEEVKSGDKYSEEAETTLKGILKEDQTLSAVENSLIDGAWRGAEAYHFYILAQSQLYNGDTEAAMKTAVYLTEFDDILEPVDVYSLLALTSCVARQFAVCSRAFIKLESDPSISVGDHEIYRKLAVSVFTKYPPIDTHPSKMECTRCEASVPDYSHVCPSCETHFPTSLVTGKPLIEFQFWLCPTCKHRAGEHEINGQRFCPLCHSEI
ncbi:hypothetical protein AB6A40_005962 [Gnathostoma spinigerum]|uniref:WD repeat-containing protein 35 n=1 Tax=Gnathostoma spinigerum TaxID=75299 RepID=A0ABD6EGZ1_9BILA